MKSFLEYLIEEKQSYWLQHRPTDIDEDDGAYRLDKIIEMGMFPKDIFKNYRKYLPSPMNKNVIRIMQSVQGKPDAKVTIYRGAPSHGVLNTGDWVTLDKEYALQYAYNNPYSDSKQSRVYMYQVTAKELSFPGDSFDELGYFGSVRKDGKLVS